MNWSVNYYTKKGGKRWKFADMDGGELLNVCSNLKDALLAARAQVAQIEAEQRGAEAERVDRLNKQAVRRAVEKEAHRKPAKIKPMPTAVSRKFKEI